MTTPRDNILDPILPSLGAAGILAGTPKGQEAVSAVADKVGASGVLNRVVFLANAYATFAVATVLLIAGLALVFNRQFRSAVNEVASTVGAVKP